MIIANIAEIGSLVSRQKHMGRKVGLVPTMGYLHDGHAALIAEAKKADCFTIVYVFVNPAQFNNREDYEKYPVNIENDKLVCEKNGVDVFFNPTLEEIYPQGIADIKITVPHLMRNLCATTRPGHFEGVLLVLSKMMLLLKPDIMFMGKKDYQQYRIMQYYAKQLGFPTSITGVATVRDEHGLALSSRNARLSEKARLSANKIPQALFLARDLVDQGETDCAVLKETITKRVLQGEGNRIDYLEILDPQSLEDMTLVTLPVLIAIAVFTEKVRLIDNIIIE